MYAHIFEHDHLSQWELVLSTEPHLIPYRYNNMKTLSFNSEDAAKAYAAERNAMPWNY
jgi:hypothetical protein